MFFLCMAGLSSRIEEGILTPRDGSARTDMPGGCPAAGNQAAEHAL
jgi:hypothetical protein